MEKKDLAVPQRSALDTAHILTKTGLSAIPYVGGPAAELFQYIIQPPLEKRRERWMAVLGEKLIDLETKGVKLENLKNNEQFISAVMHASQVALRTHQETKLQALQNAILNVANGQGPDETVQHLFFGFVDDLTELHLRILKLFRAPSAFNMNVASLSLSMGCLSSVLTYYIQELQGRQDLYDQLWKDLYSRGLVNTGSLGIMMTGDGLLSKRTTNMGDAFLRFIEEFE